MLLSLALIFLIGLVIAEIFGKLKLPRFIGMIIVGIVLGPFFLNLISDEILSVSSELRTIALVVILLRAGLNLNIEDLKKIGKPAILMSFIPATLEIIAVVIFAPLFFEISIIEAAILGSILAAVSPAVIVPKMISFIKEKLGNDKKVPQLVLASASVDDIYVIVLFTVFISIYQTGDVTFMSIINIPIAVVLGVFTGLGLGYLLSKFFAFFRVRDTVKVLIILAVSFIIIFYEELINQYVGFSALLSVMVIGMTFLNHSEERALRLRDKFDKVWVFAELVLFVLVGSLVNIEVAFSAGLLAILLLVIELFFRMIGVQLCLFGTDLNQKEKTFTGVSFIPKATVQAAIGAIPLSLGMENGMLILAIAVLSIIITAPIGAIGIDLTAHRWLKEGNHKIVV